MQHARPHSRQMYKSPSKVLVIVIAFVLFALGLGVAAIIHYWNTVRPIQIPPSATITESKAQQELICEDNWQKFERESVSAVFCFPDAWGSAQLSDGRVTPADKGKRWNVVFEKKPQVTVAMATMDWSTTGQRGNSCIVPAQATPEYEKYSNQWQLEGAKTPNAKAYRGLDVRPSYHLIEEIAAQAYGGACLRGVAQLAQEDLPFITASHQVPFNNEIKDAEKHKDNPTKLISVNDRSDFISLVRSISKK